MIRRSPCTVGLRATGGLLRTVGVGQDAVAQHAESFGHEEIVDAPERLAVGIEAVLGAGLGIWGAINLLEGYGNDNPGAKSQGMKQLMAGGGVALIGVILVPLLSGLFG